MIHVLDLGLGNPLPVVRMVERAGGKPTLTADSDDLDANSIVVVPGVGAFDAGMSRIRDRGFDAALQEIAASENGRILGLCLGMQLLLASSDEGKTRGLGLVPGSVKRLPPDPAIRLPHMGWNFTHVERKTTVTEALPPGPRFYFAHAYFADIEERQAVTLSVHHGITFCAAFEVGNVFGAQFHPEKSHRYGLQFMRGFLAA